MDNKKKHATSTIAYLAFFAAACAILIKANVLGLFNFEAGSWLWIVCSVLPLSLSGALIFHTIIGLSGIIPYPTAVIAQRVLLTIALTTALAFVFAIFDNYAFWAPYVSLAASMFFIRNPGAANEYQGSGNNTGIYTNTDNSFTFSSSAQSNNDSAKKPVNSYQRKDDKIRVGSNTGGFDLHKQYGTDRRKDNQGNWYEKKGGGWQKSNRNY